MLWGIVVGLVVGWFVALFGADNLIIKGIFELTGKHIGVSGYYTIFALLGLLGGTIKRH